jgi:hypothetical protein
MRQPRLRAIVLTSAVAVASLASSNAMAGTGVPAPAQSSQGWGNAEKVPGTGALNLGGYATINSVSCGAPGNCVAAGWYRNSISSYRPFVASEVNGSWGTASKVPGTGTGEKAGNGGIFSVLCVSAGNCTAGGYDENGHPGHLQAIVVSEVNGTWGTAIRVPGALSAKNAAITSVSCVSVGNCSAGGHYGDSVGYGNTVFVVSEVNGTWGTAREVPGIAALNTGGNASIASVSCGAAGNCTAGGQYYTQSRHYEAFVVSEVNGTWGTAIEVPGTAALNTFGYAGVASVSCASAGNCSAGGEYQGTSGQGFSFRGAFVVSEVDGTWGTAIEVPGTANPTGISPGGVTSVSCAAPGNCTAGGTDAGTSGNQQAFVASQVNGTWQTATGVPGITALSPSGSASISAVSCATVGNCSAGGNYAGSSRRVEAFVVSETNGTWGAAVEVPGIEALNKERRAGITSLSCAAPGNCSAGGHYKDGSGHRQVFVVSQN